MAALGTLGPVKSLAKRLEVTEADLRTMIEKGKINLGIAPNGEIMVEENPQADDINAQLAAIRREDFEHLRQNRISVTEGASKYNLHRDTVRIWVKKGYIVPLDIPKGRGRGSRMILDEADVAYCAEIHNTRQQAGVYAGAPLLDEQGKPNLLKHPDLSRYRRERKQTGK